jgi:hypothetical protein
MAEQTLFGSYNPQLIQQAIEAERERGLLEQAKLTPQQIINLGAARSGQQMGQALGGVVNTLFGLPSVQDPRLQQAQLGQQAYQEALQASGGDASSPAFFKQLSSSAAKLGVTTLAQQAAQQAAKLEAEQALGIQRFAAAQASLAQAAKERTPEAPLTIADRTRLNELIQQFGTNEGARRFRAERDEAELKKSKAGGTNIDLGSAFDKAFAAQDAKGQAEAWTQAGQAYNSAKPLLRQIAEVERIVPNAFTGKFAEGKLGLSKALGAFGIPIGSSAPDSEYINAISSKLVQQIAKAFPGSLAVKELDQLVKSKPNLNQEAGTILKLLGDIRDEITSQTLTYEKLAALPQKDRYSTNANIVQSQFGDRIARLRSIQRKAANGTATKEEAQEGIAIQKELGL